jgi:hypothetical protein
MPHRRVLVLGGYGTFGQLVVASLLRQAGIHVLVAGRSFRRASDYCSSLQARAVEPLALDCRAHDLGVRLRELQPFVVVDTAGPFQSRDHAVARACLETGAHYVDLADGREYVTGIAALDREARARACLLVSGASTCPALSTAVVDQLTFDLPRIDAITLAIAPGQRVPRGLATARSVLRYCGKPISSVRGSVWGWGDLTSHDYAAPVGRRWLSNIDVPELGIWPARYPTLKRLVTQAGLEIPLLHLGLSFLSRLVRLGAIKSLVPHAEWLLRVSSLLDRFGSRTGAMHIALEGMTHDGARVRRTWTVIATQGDGPQIPAAPAALITKKLLGVAGHAPLAERGARPCVGLFSLDEVLKELEPFAIRTELFEEAIPV